MANLVNGRAGDNDILSPEALQSLTGYKQPKKQQQWLASAGIWFKPGRGGYPSTTWYHVNHPLSIRPAQSADSFRTEPNFEAM
ncbi:DUF4224 domain-containing protein [Salmonella enterica]|uniref:DUF4224 domain-containing protein n=1 Tax=Salmonella enterica TaxID=28901 RepID=A0A749L193_SALER|nr:DUF4224 domain-containing protein [Salmonella enterica]EAW1193046.1 DUF4224 domain-containing protein [Salmonella enterica subsp. enterica]ECG1721339.1 DUF4224 domain-containing protein [Salmonella enterica subsp. diarizonae serovar 17:z10:e,n,x,z15]ECI2946674.1 DUF4224 domain-containing protein [Salmonella enterica subsp. diarizonae]EAP6366518.1 DUF4224 domain-containing protein [Salmonella enterica]EAR6586258.1 DUF4224 domain-containing protein [Salmonella enterica]